MLKTHSSRDSILSFSPNNRNKYLRVSARKKLSILSLRGLGTLVTSLKLEKPPSTLMLLLNASKILQPQLRYVLSLVKRYMTKSDSTVSGRWMFFASWGRDEVMCETDCTGDVHIVMCECECVCVYVHVYIQGTRTHTHTHLSLIHI